MATLRLIIPIILVIGCGIEDSELPYNYKTNHGIKVIVGSYNSPTLDTVQTWEQETLDFWNEYFGVKREIPGCIYAFFKDSECVFSRNGSGVAGLATYLSNYQGNIINKLDISNGSPIKVKYVFEHELSHILLYAWWIFNNPTGEEDHQLMWESGFDSKLGKGYASF